MASPISLGARILGGAALFLGGVLALGFFMSSSWEATASGSIDAPAADVFAYLDSPEGWRAWTPWPDSVSTDASGPASGAGSSMSWADPELGSGSFRIVEVDPPRLVRYRVEVSGGKMVTDGVIELVADAGGTRLEWSEAGDLGRNPLMGFWALSMDRAQSQELDKSVRRLGELVTGIKNDEAPADSGSTGAIR